MESKSRVWSFPNPASHSGLSTPHRELQTRLFESYFPLVSAVGPYMSGTFSPTKRRYVPSCAR